MERDAKQLTIRMTVRADSRKTECGADQFLNRLEMRAATFALRGRHMTPWLAAETADARLGRKSSPRTVPPAARPYLAGTWGLFLLRSSGMAVDSLSLK
jgi:hypothetical protein